MSHVILVLEVEDRAVTHTHTAVAHSDVAAPVLNQEENSGKEESKNRKKHSSAPDWLI